MSVFGVMIATNLSYLLGPAWVVVTSTGWYTPVVSSLAVVGLTIVAFFGLRVGKWLQRLGGLAHILTFAALILVPFVATSRLESGHYQPLAVALPTMSLLSLNIFGKMALGALSGFEYVAILAGECQNPARSIGRSVTSLQSVVGRLVKRRALGDQNHPPPVLVPPSTGMLWPVTYADMSDARNSATRAWSSGQQRRPTGAHDSHMSSCSLTGP